MGAGTLEAEARGRGEPVLRSVFPTSPPAGAIEAFLSPNTPTEPVPRTSRPECGLPCPDRPAQRPSKRHETLRSTAPFLTPRTDSSGPQRRNPAVRQAQLATSALPSKPIQGGTTPMPTGTVK